MNAQNRHLTNVLSTGMLVTILTLVGLFWARWHLQLVRLVVLQKEVATTRAQISPTGLFPFESADDPNLASPSSAAAEFNPIIGLFASLGAPRYVRSNLPGGPGSHVYQWDEVANGYGFYLYFDSSLGLMVHGGMFETPDPNGTGRRRSVTRYAGPKGIAEAPSESLGRFVSPISDGFHTRNPQTVYDPSQRRFFVIDWRNGSVSMGPELAEEGEYKPVQMGVLQKNPLTLNVMARSRLYRLPPLPGLYSAVTDQVRQAQVPRMDSLPVMVLNASGRIDLLNLDTLTLTPGVARLPTPTTLFENSRSVGPEDVAAFSVEPIAVFQRGSPFAYLGSIVGTASRDLTGVQLTSFDPNGRSVATSGLKPNPDEIYSSLPGASLGTVVQFVVEGLHPPASLLLSSLAASRVPATSDYQSLVIVPNSFAAMAARDVNLGRMNRFASSLFFMLPAIGLGVSLAWRVSRDALRIGLSKRERTAWTLVALALGLPAYITYRLTRPTVALVTCVNCGQGRRADFEKCQRCGAPWSVPELTPPAWRVLGEPEQIDMAATSPAEQASPPA